MFESYPLFILADPSGAPAFLEFRHRTAPSFRALMIFWSSEDALRWLDEQPPEARPAWAGYGPVAVKSLAPLERKYRAAYGKEMSVIDISQIMHSTQAVS